MTYVARASRAALVVHALAPRSVVAAGTATRQARGDDESSVANDQAAGRPRVRPAPRQDPLRLVPRRQVHLIRALADYGTQERVGFSLDVNHPLCLG